MTKCVLNQPIAASPGYVHVALPAPARWGCTVHGRGAGVVVAAIELGGSAVGFDVQFGDGRTARAWRAQIKPGLAVVRA